MNKALKIFIWVVVVLGILSGLFLLTAKKKTPATEKVRISQPANETLPVKNAVVPPKTNVPAPAPTTPNPQERKTVVRNQWTQCKDKTLLASTSLTWNVQITEGITVGGTYAIGNLDKDPAYPVRVTIKADSQNFEKIKAMLVTGKTAFLKGTCADVATDGSVILQAF